MTDYERCRLQNQLYDAAKNAIHEAIDEIRQEFNINIELTLTEKIELIQEGKNNESCKRCPELEIGVLKQSNSKLCEENNELKSENKKLREKISSVDEEICKLRGDYFRLACKHI